MPRWRIKQLAPPAKWWPPKPGSDENEVVIIVTSQPDAQDLQSFWLRWHVGEPLKPGSDGWRLRRFNAHNLRFIHAYWSMTGLRVTVASP